MKARRLTQQPVIDKAYIANLYSNIHQKFNMLDELNKQYHTIQEEHFLRSFMNVVQKMGNDLILAQQAYRNIDIEVKRDQYCLQLVAQLNFFKDQCYYMKDQMIKVQQRIKAIEIEKQNMEIQILSLKNNLNKKHQYNTQLQKEINALKDKLKKSHNNNNLLRRSMPLDMMDGTNKDMVAKLFINQNQLKSHIQRYSGFTPDKIHTTRRSKDLMLKTYMQKTQTQTPHTQMNSTIKRDIQTNMRSFRKRNNIRNQSLVKEYQI